MQARQIGDNAVRGDPRKILVVDDEADVLGSIQQTMDGLEYELIVTRDPQFALQTLLSDPSIELLITDLFMPGMDGAKLLDQCRQIRPGLKAILTTGAASGEQVRRWRSRGEIVVSKPWFNEELTVAVREALNG
jgi:CheY-like chemotaxis protein